MESKFNSNFIFTVCQIGAEAALKEEVTRKHPELKFAFSRPGFITFKRTGEPFSLDFVLDTVFVRAYGISLGRFGLDDFRKQVEQICSFKHDQPSVRLKLHIWERDFFPPGEEILGFVPGKLAGEFEQKIRNEVSGWVESEVEAKLGDVIFNGIVLDKDFYGWGIHFHSVFHSPFPGGRMALKLPENSPSRAYLKLEESLSWSGAPFQSGDWAVELGSAPGGASFALLNRGIRVVGIDPAEMHPLVLKNANFHHFRQPVGTVLREDLPESVQWLLLDMNVEPRISLFAVDRLVSRMKDSLLGVLLTVKLNRWSIAREIPAMLEHIRAMGMVKVRTAQLFHHRQEIVVYGLTRKGLKRSL